MQYRGVIGYYGVSVYRENGLCSVHETIEETPEVMKVVEFMANNISAQSREMADAGLGEEPELVRKGILLHLGLSAEHNNRSWGKALAYMASQLLDTESFHLEFWPSNETLKVNYFEGKTQEDWKAQVIARIDTLSELMEADHHGEG